MSLPALTIQLPTAAARREAWWATKHANRAEEDATLWAEMVAWQTDPDHLGKPISHFTAFWCEGTTEAPASLLNALDRHRARTAGYTGSLTDLAQYGRALRKGWTPERIRETEAAGLRIFLRAWLTLTESDPHPVDDADPADVPGILTGAGLSSAEVRKVRFEALEAALRVQRKEETATLTQAQEGARALLARIDPFAPSAPQEADTLYLQATQLLARENPQDFQAALRIVQAGTPDGSEAGEAFKLESRKPLRRVEFLKLHGHDFVTGDLPRPGQVRDAHHVALMEGEARSQVQPHVLVAVDRSTHIPQPFSTQVTAHSRAFTARTREGVTYALLYTAVLDARWEAHVRGEPDPYPAHLSTYLTLPTSENA